MSAIPDGFAPHTRSSPVTAPWEPIFARVGDSFELGLLIAAAHCNGRGMLHGGVTAALADNAMGLTYARALGAAGGVVTIGLTVDYAASGRPGQWLQITPRLLRDGKSMGFVDALITADGGLIARASATFRNLA
jgi:uncharacterized protein (TIGR00369 family)